jgi:hypothetical protein
MSHEKKELASILAYWRTDRQQILKVCLLVRDDCSGGSCAGIREILVQTQRSADPNKLLDRVLSVLNHLPDDPRQRVIVEKYAFGLIRGRPPYAVARFWDRVPSQAVADVAPLAAEMLG